MTVERIKGIVSKNIFSKALVLVILIMVLVFYFRIFFTEGVRFDDAFLKKEATLSESRYNGWNVYGGIQITVKGLKNKDGSAEVIYRLPNSINDKYTVEFKDAGNWDLGIESIKDENGNLLFEGEYKKGRSILIGKDGKPVFENNFRILVNGENPYNTDYRIPLLNVAEFASSANGTIRGSFELIVPAIFLFIITIIDIRFPLLFFSLKYAWDVKDPEPSDFYLAMQRVSWYAFPIIGIGLMIAALL